MTHIPSTSAVHSVGFPPIIGDSADILILGSLPGIASLTQQQYYAHKQNAFWRVLEALFQIPANADYAARCAQVKAAKLAIWDVCHSAYRPGSLDSAITQNTVIANDINGLLAQHPSIKAIAFNGNAAATLFKKHIQLKHAVATVMLPSTSPANASIPYVKKLEKWSALLDFRD
ncbi:MAG: DNA-deoxyinosine glycosylase [Methylophilus sp.]|uniref:DNA-deoxyinosine glycosylase n=1 Tax=Methylophilus sp. TaxID=29541 RepID=UPI003FA04757